MKKVQLGSLFFATFFFLGVGFFTTSTPRHFSQSLTPATSQTPTVSDFGSISLWDRKTSSKFSSLLIGLRSFSYTSVDGTTTTYDFAQDALAKLRQQVLSQASRLTSDEAKKDLFAWTFDLSADSAPWLKGKVGDFLRSLVNSHTVDAQLLQKWNETKTSVQDSLLDTLRNLLLQLQLIGRKTYRSTAFGVDLELGLVGVDNLALAKFSQLPLLLQAQLERLLFLEGDLFAAKKALRLALWQGFHDRFAKDLEMMEKLGVSKAFKDHKTNPYLGQFIRTLKSDPTAKDWSFDITPVNFIMLLNIGKNVHNFVNLHLARYKKKWDYAFFLLNINRHTVARERSYPSHELHYFRKYNLNEFLKLSNLFLTGDKLTGKAREQLITIFIKDIDGYDLIYGFKGVYIRHTLTKAWSLADDQKKEEIWSSFRPLFLQLRSLVVNDSLKSINIPDFMVRIPNFETVKFSQLTNQQKLWFVSFIVYAGDSANIERILKNEILTVYANGLRPIIEQGVWGKGETTRLLVGKEKEISTWKMVSGNNCSWWDFLCKTPKPTLVKEKVYVGKTFDISDIFVATIWGWRYDERLPDDAWEQVKTLRKAGITISQFKYAVNRLNPYSL